MKKYFVFINAAKTQYFGLTKDGNWLPVEDKTRAWVYSNYSHELPSDIQWYGQTWTAVEVDSEFRNNPGYF